jgi:hypothetical protein
LASKNQTLCLIVKGPAPIVQSDAPQLALAPTPAPSIATTAPTPSIPFREGAWARKQQWRLMNEAFCNEMQETREALLAAKAAGDFQQVNEVFISFLPLLTFSSSNEREQRKAHMASNASASSAEATTLAPTPATVPHIQRKAQEKKAVREALFAAKQAGDQNAVQEVCWHVPLSTFYSFLFSYVSNYDNNVLRIE